MLYFADVLELQAIKYNASRFSEINFKQNGLIKEVGKLATKFLNVKKKNS